MNYRKLSISSLCMFSNSNVACFEQTVNQGNCIENPEFLVVNFIGPKSSKSEYGSLYCLCSNHMRNPSLDSSLAKEWAAQKLEPEGALHWSTSAAGAMLWKLWRMGHGRLVFEPEQLHHDNCWANKMLSGWNFHLGKCDSSEIWKLSTTQPWCLGQVTQNIEDSVQLVDIRNSREEGFQSQNAS